MLRNAGGVITDDVIRSLSVSQRRLGTQAVMLIHHTDCGMQTLTDDGFRAELQDATGVAPSFAIESFTDLDADVRQSILRVRRSTSCCTATGYGASSTTSTRTRYGRCTWNEADRRHGRRDAGPARRRGGSGRRPVVEDDRDRGRLRHPDRDLQALAEPAAVRRDPGVRLAVVAPRARERVHGALARDRPEDRVRELRVAGRVDVPRIRRTGAELRRERAELRDGHRARARVSRRPRSRRCTRTRRSRTAPGPW